MAFTILAVLLAFLTAQVASLNSSTYVFSEQGANLTFTITAAADTGDLFFRFIAPGGYDWVSIGIGESMKSALMFVAYPGKNGSCKSRFDRLKRVPLMMISYNMVAAIVEREW